MVNLTEDILHKGVSSHSLRLMKPMESRKRFFKRITHLYLNNKNIDKIDCSISCDNLEVLYLYDNKISKIENMNYAPKLKRLYLQRNNIGKMENISQLQELQKLYLGYNNISVVEGLDDLNDLEEFHIEYQKIPNETQMTFEPKSIRALVYSLRVLNVNGCGLHDVTSLRPLQVLEQLFIRDNKLDDVYAFTPTIQCWRHLKELDVTGNPFEKVRNHKEIIIGSSHGIEIMNGKAVAARTRQSLQNFVDHHQRLRPKKAPVVIPETTQSEQTVTNVMQPRVILGIHESETEVPPVVMSNPRRNSLNMMFRTSMYLTNLPRRTSCPSPRDTPHLTTPHHM